MTTVATGTGGGVVTVMVADPSFPSLEAVITAAPAATPVTTPLAETVATAGSLDAHVTTRPVRVLPCASFVVAVSGPVAPTFTDNEPGVTVTVATGAGGGVVTVIVADPLMPS